MTYLDAIGKLWPVVTGSGVVLAGLVAAIVRLQMASSHQAKDLLRLDAEVSELREEMKTDRHEMRQSVQKILLSVQRIEVKLKLDERGVA